MRGNVAIYFNTSLKLVQITLIHTATFGSSDAIFAVVSTLVDCAQTVIRLWYLTVHKILAASLLVACCVR